MGDSNSRAWKLSRRAFIHATGAAATVAAFGIDIAGAVDPARRRQHGTGKAIGTVFLDRPYVDRTGLAEPYRPPASVGSLPDDRYDYRFG